MPMMTDQELVDRARARGLRITDKRYSGGQYVCSQWVYVKGRGTGLMNLYCSVLASDRVTPWDKCAVQYGNENVWCDTADVKPANFVQFCIMPTGFGQTPWAFMGVLAIATAYSCWIGQGWWSLIAWVPMMVWTFANFKRWLV